MRIPHGTWRLLRRSSTAAARLPVRGFRHADMRAATSAAAQETAGDLTALVPELDVFQSTERWVAFSDLHVSSRTRAVCLEVLAAVRREAEARGAGVLFLGADRHQARNACVPHASKAFYPFSWPVACPGIRPPCLPPGSPACKQLPTPNQLRADRTPPQATAQVLHCCVCPGCRFLCSVQCSVLPRCRIPAPPTSTLALPQTRCSPSTP